MLAVLISVHYSCIRNDDKPDSLLSQQEMSLIVADQLLAEAYASQEGMMMGVSPAILLDSVIYPEIFRRHKITYDIYRSSLTYYENDPQRLKSLMADVILLLEAKDSVALDAVSREVPLPALPREVSPEDVRRLMNDRLGGAGLKEER